MAIALGKCSLCFDSYEVCTCTESERVTYQNSLGKKKFETTLLFLGLNEDVLRFQNSSGGEYGIKIISENINLKLEELISIIEEKDLSKRKK